MRVMDSISRGRQVSYGLDSKLILYIMDKTYSNKLIKYSYERGPTSSSAN